MFKIEPKKANTIYERIEKLIGESFFGRIAEERVLKEINDGMITILKQEGMEPNCYKFTLEYNEGDFTVRPFSQESMINWNNLIESRNFYKLSPLEKAAYKYKDKENA